MGLGTALLQAWDKPLPEPVMTQIHDTIWRHLVYMSYRKKSVFSGLFKNVYNIHGPFY